MDEDIRGYLNGKDPTAHVDFCTFGTGSERIKNPTGATKT